MLRQLDHQIDKLCDQAEVIADGILKESARDKEIEHLIDTDRKLYKYLVGRNATNDNARRIIVDETIKTFRTLLYTLTKVTHRIDILDERSDKIYLLENKLKGSKFKTYALVSLFLIFCLWSMASIQTSAAHMVFQFIASLFHSANWLSIFVPK